jgi:hypothetical protein
MRSKWLRRATVALLMSATVAQAAGYPLDVRKGTDRKVYTTVNLGGKVCFTFKNAAGTPARVHLRRMSNRNGKDLDIHLGGRCLNIKGPVYEVWAKAMDEDVWVDVVSETVFVQFKAKYHF